MNYHEGTPQVKARLFETHRREYGNFTQGPGERIDDMFSRFQSIVNKVSANRSADALDYTEHEKALKLLYALDRSMWDLKVNTIIDDSSPGSESDSEVNSTIDLLDTEVRELYAALDNQKRLLKEAARERRKLRAELLVLVRNLVRMNALAAYLT